MPSNRNLSTDDHEPASLIAITVARGPSQRGVPRWLGSLAVSSAARQPRAHELLQPSLSDVPGLANASEPERRAGNDGPEPVFESLAGAGIHQADDCASHGR